MGKNGKMSLNGRKHAENEQMDRMCVLYGNILVPGDSCNGRKLARNEQLDRRFMLMKIF